MLALSLSFTSNRLAVGNLRTPHVCLNLELTEESIYNSLFMATDVTANGRTVRAIPIDSLKTILAKYGVSGR